ncbi:hypothetical protein Q5752_001200 [Cryptotrichosporon argae]
MSAPSPIVVLGAGIIGLTAAVRILESDLCKTGQHPVHIIADHLPDDPLDAYYASTIAGAHHLSFADDNNERERRWDRKTFQIMYDEWRKLGEASGLMVLKQTELYVGTKTHLKIFEEHPDFTVVDPSTVSSPPVDHSISFTSLTMTPIVYLRRLLARIAELSGGTARIHRYRLPSLSALSSPEVRALIGETPARAVVVCVGLGARTLGGVADVSVFPTRGQVVKVRAPWVRAGWTRQVGALHGGEAGERTYVIPRPDGEVILGGTREIGDYCPYPRQATRADILRRALEICPALRPAHQTAPPLGGVPDARWLAVGGDDVSPLHGLVVQDLVGFRPSREGGVRLERGDDVDGTAVCYCYGHGGAGWQSCWGTADEVVELLLKL